MPAVQETIEHVKKVGVDQYKYGFETRIKSIKAPKGLNESTVRYISAKKSEPDWMLTWRLDSFERWRAMTWANITYPKIDFQNLYYYAAPKGTEGPKSLAEVDPELLRTYAKLGIPLKEQALLAGVTRPRVAVDAVFDSVSVVTTFKEELAKAGVIFCSISEAIREHSDLVRKYLGSVVPQSDNFYAALNSAVFSDGSFVYVPEGVRCPDGAVDLLPHEREGDGPVRTHAHHRRQGRIRFVSRGLHGAHARRAPAARGGRRADRAR